MERTYRNQFPEEFWPEFDIPADWEDESWGNDMSPSFLHTPSSSTVFVNPADPAHRELPTDPRFIVASDGEYHPLETLEDVLAFLATRQVAS